MVIEYRSFPDMNEAILRNLHRLPRDIDLVVGIPRSGMLPANLIALYLNKPYVDIDSYVEGRIYTSGDRGQSVSLKDVRKVLIMDDSIAYGRTKEKVLQKLNTIKSGNRKEYVYGVVYASREGKEKVDFYCEIVEGTRAFQWNLFHHQTIIPHSCFDIDGVLCPDPTVDDDGPLYTAYIASAPILHKPSVEIDTIVTTRLEKYRDVTEGWLRSHGIKYKRLVMLDMPTKEERTRWGKHGIFKGEIYRDSDCYLFVESSLLQAEDIVRISHKPVFCIETFSMINDEQALRKEHVHQKWESAKFVIKKILRWKR